MKLNTPAGLLVPTVLLAIVLIPLRVNGQSQTASGYEGPLIFDTYTPGPCSPNGQEHGACPQGTLHRIRVVPLATGLMNPWHIAFLPDGRSMLVSESTGRLRLIRDGSLATEPISDWPIDSLSSRVLNSVLVHPQFAQNRLVYLYYAKAGGDGMTTMALARGQLDDMTLSDVREVFVADAWIKGGPIAGRAAFGPDGTIYLSVNDHDEFNAVENTSVRILAQDLRSDVGKVLRVRDDGGIPPDNPFVGRAGAKPEIFTYGHRNVTGMAWHPETGQLWATEIGPMGGDELNILLPGQNYGWPHVSLGRLYSDASVSEQSWFRPGMEMPLMYWMPAISPSGLAFYTETGSPGGRGTSSLVRSTVRCFSASRSTSRCPRHSGGSLCSRNSTFGSATSCRGRTGCCTSQLSAAPVVRVSRVQTPQGRCCGSSQPNRD